MSTFGIQTVENNVGAVAVYTAVSASDILTNNGACFLHVKNGGGSSDTLSILATGFCSQGILHSLTLILPAGFEFIIGPFALKQFGPAPVITHSFITSVTAAMFSLVA